jgi:hypothetical protein
MTGSDMILRTMVKGLGGVNSEILSVSLTPEFAFIGYSAWVLLFVLKTDLWGMIILKFYNLIIWLF